MNTDNKIKPNIDLEAGVETKTATFAMGCFWSPDALFGSLEGVIRTRVGYAGGSTENPTYMNLADHIETIQLDYNQARISYLELLSIFFNNHKPIGKPWKRQYMSAAFYHNEEQRGLVEQAKERVASQLNREIYTAVYPYEVFYLAEERHQKYKLQRQSEIMDEFKRMYPDFTDIINSTAAARVNAYLYGYGNREALNMSINGFGLSLSGQKILLDSSKDFKGVYHCSA